ncbi:MAG: alkaline phosphatase [Rikenellaceae bacterium]
MRIVGKIIALVLFATMAVSCGTGATGSSTSNSAGGANGASAKYIFYFIGDGMAAPQVQLGGAALTSAKFRDNYAAQTGTTLESEELFLKSLSVTGLATSNAANRYITDSAAAGTALATGSKTDVGIISQDADGNTLKTIAERAKESGMKVGVVSSVSIDHATPACFYAHSPSRSNYAEISDQLLTSGFDYFGGGSVRWNSRAVSEQSDKATAYAEYRKRAEESGFKFVTTLEEFNGLGKGESQAVIATLNMLSEEQNTEDGSAMPYTIDLARYSEENQITLAQFTQKGIDLLEGEDGFFMMVEGGKIDWACHANDAATCAYEVVAFDEAIGVAMAFAAKHPTETLIVVTGDHDCGGLAIGFAGTHYESAFDILASSRISYALFSTSASAKIKSGESFESLLSYACEEFGFTNTLRGDGEQKLQQTLELSDFEVEMLRRAYRKSATKVLDSDDLYLNSFGGYDPFTTTCTNILNNKSGIEFASYSHTAVPVMVFADGAGAELFSGYYDNTDIAKKIGQAAGI